MQASQSYFARREIAVVRLEISAMRSTSSAAVPVADQAVQLEAGSHRPAAVLSSSLVPASTNC